MSLEFFVPCNIEPKQGDRVRIASTKAGKRFAMHYTPGKVKRNAGNLAAIIAPHRPSEPLRGPLKLSVIFQYAWRAGASKKAREAKLQPKDKKPDLDNCIKQLLDVMQSCGFFVNDSQVADLHAKKVWTTTPGVFVKLETIVDPD
jgi:Holliday junction resolvase RusA-like endonuclease